MIKLFNPVLLIFVLAITTSVIAQADKTSKKLIIINLGQLSQPPLIDGELSEWAGENWHLLSLKPAMTNDTQKLPEEISLQIKTAIIGEIFYVAAKWPDSSHSVEYKNWVWRGNKYHRDKKLDDMFALRFDMAGDYNQCMISKSNYSVDVWLWSSGRSNLTRYAEDMNHHISTRLIENAAEYEYKNETGPATIIYIKKKKDSGVAAYKNVRIKRKKNRGKKLNSIKIIDNPSGSIIDVQAKALWSEGFWHLEMARKLNTGNTDDVDLSSRDNIKGAIAIFNHNSAEHKNKSSTLLFKLKP